MTTTYYCVCDIRTAEICYCGKTMATAAAFLEPGTTYATAPSREIAKIAAAGKVAHFRAVYRRQAHAPPTIGE